MGNPKKSKDTITFNIVNDEYEKYRECDLKLAHIYINGIGTSYYVRNDGKAFSSFKKKNGNLKELKPIKMNKGYMAVHMSVNNVSYIKLLHRLVACAFIPNPENKPEVNHKDGNKSHNYELNLEWSTEKENIIHSYKTGLHGIQYGEENPQSKITERQAIKICKLLEKNKLSIKEISKKVGCTKSIVKNILQHRSWVNVSNNYNIDKYDIKESTNGKLRMNKKLVRKICSDLSSGKYSISEISKKYNIPYSRVNDIKQRKTWKEVSKSYDFSNYKNGKSKRK